MANRIVLNETSYHGSGAIKEIVNEVKGRNLKKAFVCSDPDLIKFNVTTKVTNILEDIKENCSIETNYRFDQSNRIDSYICKAYKVKPEFLGKSNPSSGVYRHLENRKWFGLIMNIDKRKLDFKSSDEIEIINLKITPQIIEEKLKSIGYFKAYHMNKKSWISVSLDDSLSDEEIIRLIDLSFGLTKD